MTESSPPEGAPAPREPVLKAPWPVLILLGALGGAYALQTLVGADAAFARFGFVPSDLAAGRWLGLVTSMFLHGGAAHLAMNAAAALAFGSPVARFLGLGARGGALFFIFYLICGVLAGYAYARLHPGLDVVLVGASGAVFGLIGAATRLLAGRDWPAPLFHPQVLGMSAAWIGLNLLTGLIGFAPGMEGALIAWEAHVAGYVAGLLLIGPAGWLAGRR